MNARVNEPLSTFLHVPKAAGTSITNWLKDNLSGVATSLHHRTRKEMLKEHTTLGFTYCVVRNPYDRMLSGYFYKLKKAPIFVEQYPTFEDYVKKCDDKVHIPQWKYFEKADLILKQENLIEDFKQIQDYYKCYAPLPHSNRSEHNSWEQYYTDDLKQYVYKHYQKDFELLKYPK